MGMWRGRSEEGRKEEGSDSRILLMDKMEAFYLMHKILGGAARFLMSWLTARLREWDKQGRMTMIHTFDTLLIHLWYLQSNSFLSLSLLFPTRGIALVLVLLTSPLRFLLLLVDCWCITDDGVPPLPPPMPLFAEFWLDWDDDPVANDFTGNPPLLRILVRSTLSPVTEEDADDEGRGVGDVLELLLFRLDLFVSLGLEDGVEGEFCGEGVARTNGLTIAVGWLLLPPSWRLRTVLVRTTGQERKTMSEECEEGTLWNWDELKRTPQREWCDDRWEKEMWKEKKKEGTPCEQFLSLENEKAREGEKRRSTSEELGRERTLCWDATWGRGTCATIQTPSLGLQVFCRDSRSYLLTPFPTMATYSLTPRKRTQMQFESKGYKRELRVTLTHFWLRTLIHFSANWKCQGLRIPTFFLSFLFFFSSLPLSLFFSFLPPPSHDQSEPETTAEAIPSSPSSIRVLYSSSLFDSQLLPFPSTLRFFHSSDILSLPINNSFRPIFFSCLFEVIN